jgi:hypothetical protein
MEQDTSRRAGASQPGRDQVLRNFRAIASSRGFSWELTDAEFDHLATRECSYCRTPPGNVNGDFTYTGLDRKDRSLGWTAQNTAPCCHMCFSVRGDMAYGEFTAYLHRLISNHAFRDVATPEDLFGPES